MSSAFDEFCEALSKPFGRFAESGIDSLPFGDEKRMVTIEQGFSVDFSILAYGRWIKKVCNPAQRSASG